MTRRTLARRLRSCASQERGFTIVETMIAMVVIFGSLTALAYTATIGFRYISYGRDRQQATGYANKIMEEIRGQAYSTIQQGLASTDLTGDSRIVNCSGTYRFESCSGTKIVSSVVPDGTTAQWIIPHQGTTTVGNLPVSWATYVTNENIVNNPYTVTVIVSWSGGRDRRRAEQPRAAREQVLFAYRLRELLDPPVRGSVPALLLRARRGPGGFDHHQGATARLLRGLRTERRWASRKRAHWCSRNR